MNILEKEIAIIEKRKMAKKEANKRSKKKPKSPYKPNNSVIYVGKELTKLLGDKK